MEHNEYTASEQMFLLLGYINSNFIDEAEEWNLSNQDNSSYKKENIDMENSFIHNGVILDTTNERSSKSKIIKFSVGVLATAALALAAIGIHKNISNNSHTATGNSVETTAPSDNEATSQNNRQKQLDSSDLSDNMKKQLLNDGYVQLDFDNAHNSYKIDLDGDGVADEIKYSVEKSTEVFSNVFITVNDTQTKLELCESPTGLSIVDLDFTDNEYELAYMDEGLSDDDHTKYFYWDNAKLETIADISSFPKNNIYNVDNTAGLFKIATRCDIVLTTNAFLNCRFDTATHKISYEYPEDGMFDYIHRRQAEYPLLQDVALFANIDDANTSLKANKGDIFKCTKVKLAEVNGQKYSVELTSKADFMLSLTDKVCWVLIETDKGVSGWVKIVDGNIDNVDATEIFGDLYAD